MQRSILSTALMLASWLALGSVAAQEAAKQANPASGAAHPTSTFFKQAKITVTDRARADGYLRVRLTPENGQAREATIATEKRMSENEIAKSLTEALKTAVGPDFKIDRDSGEIVKISKAKRDTANFSVEVTFSSPGFSIILEN